MEIILDKALQMPSSPYPGLRPFLDHESSLLFGRDDQVREITQLLSEKHFVAIIGGSGSGKSSLIRAGVVPHLRSFGIKGAGDLWLPVVFTPGTQTPGHASENTAITRLAYSFSRLLSDDGRGARDPALIDRIGKVFRQENGFARLVDVFTNELALAKGPNPNDARILFVIDQFEELFHPSNEGDPDRIHMIERVIDHFFNPHPRCFVVLTMRSEHLNDCAAYLQLPEAINDSFFLVRRLDEENLRLAIEGPAQRYLRMHVRAQADADLLPESVHFEPEVVKRLVDDARAIAHDPDHLPLLQHALARLWQAALERTQSEHVPANITPLDLNRAIKAAKHDEVASLQPNCNVLRDCLENWANETFSLYGLRERSGLDKMLKELGFKDPNTGHYTQQRIGVSDCAQLIAPDALSTDQLFKLLDGRFIGSVNYLYWDNEEPARVTIKVSHESFIRGWSHFRAIVDRDAERFDEFLTLLRKCEAWLRGGRSRSDLLERGDLRRMEDCELDKVFADESMRKEWFHTLLLYRDGGRLNTVEPSLDQFIERSNNERQREQSTRKNTWRAMLAIVTLAIIFGLQALYSWRVQGPIMNAADKLFQANSITQNIAPGYVGAKPSPDSLDRLMTAGTLVSDGRSLPRYIDYLTWVPSVFQWTDFHAHVVRQMEPSVNRQIRTFLNGRAWVKSTPQRVAMPQGDGSQRASCQVTPETHGSALRAMDGRLFQGSTGKKGIFVPDAWPERPREVVLLTTSGSAAQCAEREFIIGVPKELAPHILVDVDRGYFLLATFGTSPAASLNNIDTARQWGPLLVVTGFEAASAVQAAVDRGGDVKRVRTGASRGGFTFALPGAEWRFVMQDMYPIDDSDKSEWAALDPADRACTVLHAKLRQSILYPDDEMYVQANHCFRIQRGEPLVVEDHDPIKLEEAVRTRTANPYQPLYVAVYNPPEEHELTDAKYEPPAPIAAVQVTRKNAFTEFDKGKYDWYVGTSGQHQGWIAARQKSDTKNWLAAPWSTDALVSLVRDIQQGSGASGRQAPEHHVKLGRVGD